MRSMQQKLSKVKYVHSKDLEELNKLIQNKIRAGWDLMGPVLYMNDEYVQQVFKTKFEVVVTPDLPPENAVENQDLAKFKVQSEVN